MGVAGSSDKPRVGWYQVYVLCLLLMTYLSSQLDRFLLPVCTEQIAQELGYGDTECQPSFYYNVQDNISCTYYKTEDSCENVNGTNGLGICSWVYTGTGEQYDLLVGPIFVVVNSISGVIVGLLADCTNRKNLLAASVFLWSIVTCLTGLVQEYWQLALLRFLLGFCEAGTVPLPASLIASYFPLDSRSTAMGIFYFGIYGGLAMSFAIGNYVGAFLGVDGWRKVFYICGAVGIPIALLVGVTVKEPGKDDVTPAEKASPDNRVSFLQQIKISLRGICQAPLLLLCLSSAVRNIGGYTWVNFTESYFLAGGGSPTELALYLPLVTAVGGGTSVFFGGIIADKLTQRYGPPTRLRFIAATLILATPLCACTLLADQPGAYFVFLAALIIGEVWMSVSVVAVVEMVPASMRASAAAFNVLCISNTAALGILLVAPLQAAFQNADFSYAQSLRDAIMILWPGTYMLGAVLYLFTALVMLRYPALCKAKGQYDQLDGVSLKEHETH